MIKKKKIEKKLIVDLDNSLIKNDLFVELLCTSIFKNPIIFFKTIFYLCKSKALAKIFLSENVSLDIKTIPYNQTVIQLINNYKEKKYKIILSTGASKVHAEKIVRHLKIFDDYISTDEKINNVGNTKLQLIKDRYDSNFIYIGDSLNDLSVWKECGNAIIVGKNRIIEKKLRANDVNIIQVIHEKNNSGFNILNQFRIHQWSKNLLLFVPSISSHKIFQPTHDFTTSLLGFFSFSLAASSIYILNDIIDLNNDRSHPKKAARPLASGSISIVTGLILFLICLFSSLIISISVGQRFFTIIAVYFSLNFFYSKYIKKLLIIDVVLLTLFYTIRIIAGHLMDHISFSSWLLSFSIFFFFSLALLKRYSDLLFLDKKKLNLKTGRGYKSDDASIIQTLGVSSGLISALVLILYTGSEQVQILYQNPIILVGLSPGIIIWISRIWLHAGRGKVDIDPVLYALKDRYSYYIIFYFLTIFHFSGISY